MAWPIYQQYANATGSATTPGPQTPVALDYMISPFEVSVAVVIVTGTATFGVEYSLDEITGQLPIRWVATSQIPLSTTTSTIGALSTPVTAIRLNIPTLGANSTVELKVLQGGKRAY